MTVTVYELPVPATFAIDQPVDVPDSAKSPAASPVTASLNLRLKPIDDAVVGLAVALANDVTTGGTCPP